MTTLATLQQDAITLLRDVSDTARLDAELLIAHVLGIPRTRFITQPDSPIEAQQLNQIQEYIGKRQQGYPVAYLIGTQHFWDVELNVTEATLIPRPETELLVETALTLYPAETEITLADLGTGSGAIAIALAKTRPHWRILATDRYPATLAIAQHNAVHYQLNNITFLQSDWFENVKCDTPFDMIISNPPYVADHDPHLQQGDVQFEPQQALCAGKDGLDDIRQLIAKALLFLKPGGRLMLEHGYDQGMAVKDLFTQANYHNIEQKTDLGGHIRTTFGCIT